MCNMIFFFFLSISVNGIIYLSRHIWIYLFFGFSELTETAGCFFPCQFQLLPQLLISPHELVYLRFEVWGRIRRPAHVVDICCLRYEEGGERFPFKCREYGSQFVLNKHLLHIKIIVLTSIKIHINIISYDCFSVCVWCAPDTSCYFLLCWTCLMLGSNRVKPKTNNHLHQLFYISDAIWFSDGGKQRGSILTKVQLLWLFSSSPCLLFIKLLCDKTSVSLTDRNLVWENSHCAIVYILKCAKWHCRSMICFCISNGGELNQYAIVWVKVKYASLKASWLHL